MAGEQPTRILEFFERPGFDPSSYSEDRLITTFRAANLILTRKIVEVYNNPNAVEGNVFGDCDIRSMNKSFEDNVASAITRHWEKVGEKTPDVKEPLDPERS